MQIPQLCLVVLIGPSGSGKSTLARRLFQPSEIVSTDACRAMLCNDENDQSINDEAFHLFHNIISTRLKLGHLTVADATNLQPQSRQALLQIASRYHVLSVAVVLDMPEELCLERARQRSEPGRNLGKHVVRSHVSQLRRSLKGLRKEGFRQVEILRDLERVNAFNIERTPVWNNLRHLRGPFDIIGDVHGCLYELQQLLQQLGNDRQLIFVGDLVDRGPDSPGVLRTVMDLVESGRALCVPGNHDVKLLKKLQGKNVVLSHGLDKTVEQLSHHPPEFLQRVEKFLDGLISHYVLDDGRLVVAHAGLREEMHGRTSGRVREFCLYGETTGESDEFGLPVRYNWASEYRGAATVVYGHTPVVEPLWQNKTVNIDTGCVFGGKLTALRYPEMELVSLPAREVYSVPVRPLQVAGSAPDPAQSASAVALELADFATRRTLHTRYGRGISVHHENAVAALELMSRFAVDPRWLIYLPPTMSPCETPAAGAAHRSAYLEHPCEALEYYQREGIERVICQEKHMGSRAVIVVCQTPEVAQRRFLGAKGCGRIYTRSGRAFWPSPEPGQIDWETQVLTRLQSALQESGLWQELGTDWVCLDAEILPWSAKAESLVREQYAAVGSAAQACLDSTWRALQQYRQRPPVAEELPNISDLLDRYQSRFESVDKYRQAYRRYCWKVDSPDQLGIAIFQWMAGEKQFYAGLHPHGWHLEKSGRLHQVDRLFRPTKNVVLATNQFQEASDWWNQATSEGGEGMVVKPLSSLTKGRRGWVQPGIKCRGSEYLRIIYGPDYLQSDNLHRLQQRNVGAKRVAAMREFWLGLEALQRFVEFEPLNRIHECVFAILALESEPIDPRL